MKTYKTLTRSAPIVNLKPSGWLAVNLADFDLKPLKWRIANQPDFHTKEGVANTRPALPPASGFAKHNSWYVTRVAFQGFAKAKHSSSQGLLHWAWLRCHCITSEMQDLGIVALHTFTYYILLHTSNQYLSNVMTGFYSEKTQIDGPRKVCVFRLLCLYMLKCRLCPFMPRTRRRAAQAGVLANPRVLCLISQRSNKISLLPCAALLKILHTTILV